MDRDPSDVRGDTKDRILDAAELLFMEHGYEATSLRQVTAAAEANLAAVNYHFGGKETLFHALFARRLDPMNRERIELLGELEQKASGRPLAVEEILTAMFVPALRMARDPSIAGGQFLRLLGRAYTDPSPAIREFLSDRYADVIARFRQAFSFALPDIPRQELTWRLHFTMGALAYTLAGADAWQLIAGMNAGDAESDEMLLRRLLPFLAAGLRAPLPEEVPLRAVAGT